MTEQVEKLLKILRERKYRQNRTYTQRDLTKLADEKDQYMQISLLMQDMLKAQKPWLVEGDLFGFNRSEVNFADIRLEDGSLLSEHRCKANVTVDFEGILAKGMDALLEDIQNHRESAEGEAVQFYDAVILAIRAALEIADR